MIGYYVHHQGRGHLTRAACIAAALVDVTDEVVGLSSAPRPAAGFAGWVVLPADDDGPHPVDVTAGGALHWAPVRTAGVAARVAALTGWIATHHPRAMVVDVSVEATVAARLAGVPTVVVAMPGDRGDAAHQLAYRLADRILAFWPRELYDPDWVRSFAGRTHFLGALSRFDDRVAVAAPGGRRVLLLLGAGGSEVRHSELAAARAATAEWTWDVLGGPDGRWHADPWPALCAADVVVTHAGQNALAEVAAARRPAVVIAQRRPFNEQHATAEALHRAGIVHRVPAWPTATGWPGVLARAAALDPLGWARWSTGEAAKRAAHVVLDAARRGPDW